MGAGAENGTSVGSVITHYDTFILRLQSAVGSPRENEAASVEAAICVDESIAISHAINAINAANSSERIGVHKDVRVGRTTYGQVFGFFQTDVAMVGQKLQRGEKLLCFLEELASTHLK